LDSIIKRKFSVLFDNNRGSRGGGRGIENRRGGGYFSGRWAKLTWDFIVIVYSKCIVFVIIREFF
jgi:hypothetical protein